MSVTNTLTANLSVSISGTGKAISGQVGSYAGAQEVQEAIVVPASTTNQHVVISFPFATLQLLLIKSSQDITIKVNSSTTPTETFTVKKTAALMYGTDFAVANPLAHDVTDLYITNAGTTDAAVDLFALHN